MPGTYEIRVKHKCLSLPLRTSFLNFKMNCISVIQFILNDRTIETDLPPGMVILDLIRYQQHLTGTKIGCREGDCGACTVLVGELVDGELRYRSMTSCLMPLGNAHGKHIVTVEGINQPGVLTPVQQAMSDCGATQCGFCTPGFVMSLTGFCISKSPCNYSNAIAAVDGNICRCTGYKSIERAASIVVEKLRGKKDTAFLVEQGVVPAYFNDIKERLVQLKRNEKARNVKDPSTQKERLHAVGGGTDLYVQKHEEMTAASINFIFDRMEWNEIRVDRNECVLGPSVTVTDLLESDMIRNMFPAFGKYARLVSSTPIRNMATIAGNFINASPIGDFTIFFLALDAQLVLTNGGKSRNIPLRKLYQGYKKLDKTTDELIGEIRFTIPTGNFLFHFEKVSKRTHLDIASVNSAACILEKDGSIKEASLSAGGVGPIPLFLEKTSAFLIGKKISEETAEAAIEIVKTEISPISDARGSKEYKTLLLTQLIKAHFREFINKKQQKPG